MAKDGKTIIATPVWVFVVRIFQFILSLIVMGCAAWFIHGLYLSSLGFAVVCSLFTWIIFVYAIVSEKVIVCRGAYNTWAVLCLDGLMILFWLSAMGAVAAARGNFKYDVVASCVSDGSSVNSGHCTISKRVNVASYAALDVMSGVAGISAIIMLLFVATFAHICLEFRRSCVSSPADAEKQTGVTGNANDTTTQYQQPGVEMQSNVLGHQHTQPLLDQQLGTYAEQEQPKWAEVPAQSQHVGYSHHAPPEPQYYKNQPYDPYVQQNTGYAGASELYSPNQIGQQHHVSYSQQGTPAPSTGSGLAQELHKSPTYHQ